MNEQTSKLTAITAQEFHEQKLTFAWYMNGTQRWEVNQLTPMDDRFFSVWQRGICLPFELHLNSLLYIEIKPESAEPTDAVRFAPNVAEWRNAISWMWRDQLRHDEHPTIEYNGANLHAGDVVDQNLTHTLYRLISPLNPSIYYGRPCTAWKVVSVNTPHATESTEIFF